MCFADDIKMTSPAISKGEEKPKNGNGEEKEKSEKKSPSHSTNGVKTPSRAESRAGEVPEQPEPFGWCRIFKLADLMIKQGC